MKRMTVSTIAICILVHMACGIIWAADRTAVNSTTRRATEQAKDQWQAARDAVIKLEAQLVQQRQSRAFGSWRRLALTQALARQRRELERCEQRLVALTPTAPSPAAPGDRAVLTPQQGLAD